MAVNHADVTLLVPLPAQAFGGADALLADSRIPSGTTFTEIPVNAGPWQLQLLHLLGVDSLTATEIPMAAALQQFEPRSLQQYPQQAAPPVAPSAAPSARQQDTLQVVPPVALQATAATTSWRDQALVCADPVHWQADRDAAVLLAADTLRLTLADAQSLTAAINALLQNDGLQLHPLSASRWVLAGQDGAELNTLPPQLLERGNSTDCLPAGQDNAHWRRLLTECQMVLHDHPVNLRRVAEGQLAINSLWFWGGAELPAVTSDLASHTIVYTDDDYAAALAQAYKTTVRPVNAFAGRVRDHRAVLAAGERWPELQQAAALTDEGSSDYSMDYSMGYSSDSAAGYSTRQSARYCMPDAWWLQQLAPAINELASANSAHIEIIAEDGTGLRVERRSGWSQLWYSWRSRLKSLFKHLLKSPLQISVKSRVKSPLKPPLKSPLKSLVKPLVKFGKAET